MPTFIDRHQMAAVPRATQQQLYSEAVHGLVDASGTKPLANWIEDGIIYCILVAPADDAVCQHHAARGLDCDDVHLMTELREMRRPSREDQAVVRAAIDALWHPDGPTVTPLRPRPDSGQPG
jgi:hypothetical protein